MLHIANIEDFTTLSHKVRTFTLPHSLPDFLSRIGRTLYEVYILDGKRRLLVVRVGIRYREPFF